MGYYEEPTELQRQCSHFTYKSRWVQSENWMTGEDDSYTDHSHTESDFKDLDLHRFQCSKCKLVGYYSSAAFNFYVKGIESSYFSNKG